APWYVAEKNLQSNTLVVVQGSDHPLLFSDSLTTTEVHWINGNPEQSTFKCMAKTRYRQPDQSCQVTVSENNVSVTFDQTQRAVTPGQSVVFYQQEICLGGGVIEST